MSSTNDEQIIQPYWRWSKKDFFPEESFQSWSTYRSALSQTFPRFKNRLLTRSQDSAEINTLRKQSENDMKRCLNWWDLMWFGFGAVIGAGIFVLTGQEANKNAGPAIVLSYVASGFSAMLSVFCYTEFAIEIPVAGGSFAYLRVELGDFVAFVTVSRDRLTPWLLARITLIVKMTHTAISTEKEEKRCTRFLHADPSNMKPFTPYGVEGVFRAAAIVYFAYGGFDAIATMAEETKNPSRDIPLGLLGSMSIITVIYCLMALSLTMMQKYNEIDTGAAYSVAFGKVGMKWAKYLVALGALKGMTTVLLVGALGQARYITHIARAHMIPPWFALVHPKTKTPVNATLLVTISSACIAFFSSLDVLASLLSVSTLFVFMMMAVALIVRRYYAQGVTPQPNLLKLICFLAIIVASSIGISACWGLKSGWVGYAVTVPLWFLGTLGISVVLPQQRTPKVWGVPLVPWLPSLSIATNLFLMGSLEYMAFIRFGICTVIMLIYYVLFGLHATYDMAHQQPEVIKPINVIEEGGRSVVIDNMQVE